MLNFNFQAPTKILFGKNKIEELPAEIKHFGKRILLAYGGGSIKTYGLYSKLTDLLRNNNIEYKELSDIEPNPRITSVRKGAELCKEFDLQLILAVGGGSVIDCCKNIAAAAKYDGDAWDFLIGKANVTDALPIASVLTLSATGSEMNAGAVISNWETNQKLVMSSPLLIPKVSVLDPTYTFTVNKWQTAAGTTDIFTHVCEQYFSTIPNTDIQDRISEAIMLTCIQYGMTALDEPENYEARANLMWASSLALNGMISTGKVGDWSTHMIEHELSAYYDITHGAGLAIILPHWMEYVLDETNVWKFETFAKNVWKLSGNNSMQLAKEAIAKTREFFTEMGMPQKLVEVDINEEYLPKMAKHACRYGSLGFFKKLSEQDVFNILKSAL